ncbi:MAG: Fe-S cluster assembly protein SufD [Nitrososphaerales archaeon]
MENNALSLVTNDYVRAISQREPSWLRERREYAFSYYQNLPAEVSPLYNKYSGVSTLKLDSILLSSDHRTGEPFSELRYRIDEARSGICAVHVGNNFYSVHIPEKFRGKLVIESINDAVKKHEELLKRFLTSIDPTEDKFLALECALFTSGIFVYVPRDLELDESITIINTLNDDGTSSVASNVIFLDENSRASVVQELYGPQKVNGNNHQTYFEFLEAYVANNSNLELVTLQAMSGDNAHISNRKAFVERDGRINWYIGAFGSSIARYKVDNLLVGEGAYAEHSDIIFGNKNQAFDVTADLTHMAPNTRGRVLAKSVLKDTAKSLFKGMIRIRKNAKASESYLAGHAILLDKGAKSDAIPGLEIETNEVKATHSASVAQMDEEQLFYLMSRGFSKESTRRIIIDGFIEPLARRMSPKVRAWINYLIDCKWQGRPLILKTDEIMREMIEVEEARVVDLDIFEKHYKYR